MTSTVAFTGGRVLPIADEHGNPADPIDGGVVLVTDGKVDAVGADVRIPDDAHVVNAAGRWVLPGFFEPHAHVGIHEEADGWAGDDTNEMTDPNGARLRAIDAVNPADEGFRDALRGGVTAALIKPGSGNPIGGQTVAVKTWGRIVDEMLISDSVSVKSALGENPKRVYGEQKKLPSTRMGTAAVIRDAFRAAEDYRSARDAAELEGKPFTRDGGLETLVRVLDGELAWDQHTHRADDIATAVRLSEEFGYRLVVNHGTEGHLIADYLADKHIPVIIGPLFTSRSKVELRNRHLRTPGALAGAGVRIAITTDHPVVPIDFLVYQAALAMKEGLEHDEALRALTINPARMMGLDHRIGSLTPGRDADIVLWDGDPLDVMSRAREVYIGGNRVYRYDAADPDGSVAGTYRV
ncbi:amidohydrolase [Spelaeicoccus albus]|uniref:Imidazolonepropionase-like amidohydrolase n=1 Tax=Spelaeicoccus albus TaxID=1280376 RepID=A0A7Z0D1E4_9MICO|nr:amidohydrolase [Spelaeicoccus albus]NYI65950.1 imidazolonepropionase-like amidohydrolase [Spelaeicoccus albus]